MQYSQLKPSAQTKGTNLELLISVINLSYLSEPTGQLYISIFLITRKMEGLYRRVGHMF